MFEKRWELYELINKFPELDASELSKKLNWSIKKINRHLKRLIEDLLIVARYSPKKLTELID